MNESEKDQLDKEIALLQGWHESADVWCVPNGERQPHLTTGWAVNAKGVEPYGYGDEGPLTNGPLGIYSPTRSEEASARLLEMMPDDLEIMRHPVKGERWYTITVERFSMRPIEVTFADRKVAIALAAKAYLEARKK